ncbi:hypothetical protein DSO57_1028965 [Entomophthora muscae]|uniref:Uncharacterized protein n=1 Tax=Entomophthora muscae TaxID=34485 RepID=A0ACC2RSF7_9FUNG|nr:hypothetical protein DSO57_1028965 [Entomophthora muscae]
MDYVLLIAYGFASLSILAASLVLTCLFMIWLYDTRLVDRVSLRLSAGLSIIDILKCISYCLYISKLDELGCRITAFLKVTSLLCHITLTVSVALNLQLVFLHSLFRQRWWEKAYWSIGLGLPIVVGLVGIFIKGFLGKNEMTGYCFYGYSGKGPYLGLSIWLGFLVWVILGSLYFLAIGGLSMKRLFLCSRAFRQSELEEGGSLPYKPTITKESVPLLMKRICFYCFVPLFTISGCLAELAWGGLYQETTGWLISWDILVANLSGVLNFIGFLFDPALRNALTCIHQDFLSLQSTYTSPEAQLTHHRSSMHLQRGGNWDPKCSISGDKANPCSLAEGLKYHRHPWVCRFFCWLLVRLNHPGLDKDEIIENSADAFSCQSSAIPDDFIGNGNRLSVPLSPLISNQPCNELPFLDLDLPGALIDFPFLNSLGSTASVASWKATPRILVTDSKDHINSTY